MWWVAAEAFVAGVAIVGTELYIMYRHCVLGRSIWYYYPIPIAHGTWLVAASLLPRDLFVNLAATLFAAVTTLNSHNTFVPHTLTVREHMLFDVADGQTLVQDLYAHRYRPSFGAGGYALQVLYALMCIFHVSLRAWVVADLLS